MHDRNSQDIGPSTSSSPKAAKLAKAKTFTQAHTTEKGALKDLERVSLTRHSLKSISSPPEQERARRGAPCQSVLSDEGFGQRYAYGAAEGAALTSLEPWKIAAAVVGDMGQFLLGSVGWKPSQAIPENDDSKFLHSSCQYRCAKLKKQAEDCAARNKSFQKATRPDGTQNATEDEPFSESLPANARTDVRQSADGEEGLKMHEGRVNEQKKDDIQYEESHSSDSEETLADEDTTEKSSTTISKKGLDLNRSSLESSQANGDITVSGNGHYRPDNDAILRLETMTPNEVRFLNIMLWVWLIIAAAFLVYLFVQKIADDDSLAMDYHSTIINTALGGLCFVVLTTTLICHLTRVILTIKHKKLWKPRRKKAAIYATIELVTQWLNIIFFLLPNLESYGPHCFQLRHPTHIAIYAILRWTCWNTFFFMCCVQAHNATLTKTDSRVVSSGGKNVSSQARKSLRNPGVPQDQAVMDQPFLQVHSLKFILWIFMEVTTITCGVYYRYTVGIDVSHGHISNTHTCPRPKVYCGLTDTQLGLTSIMVFSALLYFALYCYYIRRAFSQLKLKSASDFRILNIVIRIQMRLRFPAFAFFSLSVILLWYVKPFSCRSLIDTWFGMLPGQIAVTAAVCLYSFIAMPKLCDGTGSQNAVLQVWLQEFAWTEDEKPKKLVTRNSSGPQDSELSREPMFCVETMMKSLYWSLLIYDFDEVDDSKLSLEEGCSLFDPPLERYELFWEKSLDTKMILAWSRKKIVLSFRGTASLANVAADLQAWRMVHTPKRGPCWSRPKVHSGFDKAWRNNGLNKRVLDRIKRLFCEQEVDKCSVQFLVTGHSLGGALATLAAYDVRAIGKFHGCTSNVTCMTFGAPRTGNHSFARDLEQMVPDTWHIINDQDVVAKGAKFIAMYKRGGHRVLINKLGDLIVRPTAMEASIRLIPCSGSVAQHLLTSYLQSLLAVLLTQFTQKKLKGGMSGVVHLAQKSIPLKRLLLEEANLTYDDLVYMMRWGAYAPRVAELAALPITVRKKGSLQKDTASRDVTDPKPSTRGGTLLGCCAPISVWIKDASGKPDKAAAEDVNIVNGDDVKYEDKV